MQRGARALAVAGLASPVLLLITASVLPGAFLVAMAAHAVTVLVTATAMSVNARRGDPLLRTARRWFARALVVSALGFVGAAVHATLVGEVPLLSPANLSVIGWVGCALIGLFSLPSSPHREGGRWRAVLDAVVVACATTLLFWFLLLADVYGNSEVTWAARAVLLVYPVADLVVAVAALALTAHVRSDVRRFLQLSAVGLLLVAASDAGNASLLGAARGFSWTNVALQAGLAVLLCAALLPPRGVQAQDTRVGALFDAALPYAPVVLTVPVALVHSVAHGSDPVVFGLGGLMVLALVARQLLYASHLSAVAHRLSVEAAHDPLTGLLNRRSFLTALAASLAELPPGQVAVVLIDLDGFKEINDTFGHDAGDRALTSFANRMSATVDDGTRLSRLGGDEFAVLCTGRRAERVAAEVAASLTTTHRTQIGAVNATVGASAGVATSRAGDTTSRILRRADLAMYEAKRAPERRVALFVDEMSERAERRHLLTQALAGAALRGELRLLYQPLFRLADGALVGAEALLRWRSPVHGEVAPEEFVPLAEETGLIEELGRWVLAQAMHDVRAWRSPRGELPRLFVNVSARQLNDVFAHELTEFVERAGVAPSAVVVEVTESAMPGLHANECMAQLRTAGFAVAMDDFGAGFSSLAQLAALPVDVLKFDRELVRASVTPQGRHILQAMTTLARELGLTTVAEGVETAAEADVVRAARCELAQGFHFSRPVTAVELHGLLHAQLVPPPRAVGPDVLHPG